MQRPKRPGRYHDPMWKPPGMEDYARPGTPTPDSRLHRMLRDRYDNRYDPRDCKNLQIVKYGSRITRKFNCVNVPPQAYKCQELTISVDPWICPPVDDGVMYKQMYSHQPPRPRSPPPPSSMQNEPMPGPSTSKNNSFSSSSSVAPSDSRTSGDNKDVISRLLSVLECPVCFEYVTPPILQCQEGHLVCSGCRSRLEHCPKCRQPFADIRARALEQVAEVVPYPCYHTGCSAMLPLSERQAHDQVCPYRTYPCTLDLCLWVGRRSSLPQHMSQEHADCLVTSASHDLSLNLTQHVNEEKVFLMQCYDELFHCVMGVDCQQDIFVGFVMYLGARDKASDYKFELNFKREGPPYTSVSIVRTVLEETATGTPVGINSGINAVVISFSTLREVIQDTSGQPPILPVHISVYKRQAPELKVRLDHSTSDQFNPPPE